MAQARTAPLTQTAVRVNAFLAQVYLIMSIGLVVTAVVAGYVAQDQQLVLRITTNPWIAWGLFFIQIMLVVSLAASVGRLSTGAAFVIFVLYAALTGLMLSSIVLLYSPADISAAFWPTAGTFFVMSIYGLITKRDLTGQGPILAMLLLGWLIAYMFNIFFFTSVTTSYALTFAGVAIFVALTAHDTQKLKLMGQQVSGPARGGLAVVGALTLYLDFINIFLLMLRARSR